MSDTLISSLQLWVLSLHILVFKCLAPAFSLKIIKGRSSIEKSKMIKAEMFWLQLETHQSQSPSPPHAVFSGIPGVWWNTVGNHLLYTKSSHKINVEGSQVSKCEELNINTKDSL